MQGQHVVENMDHHPNLIVMAPGDEAAIALLGERHSSGTTDPGQSPGYKGDSF